MTDEVHPLVTLLVARAKSHPEEFKRERADKGGDRWWMALDTILRNGTDADKALIDSTVGRIAMDEAHAWALDELLNGEERRAAERREAEEAEKRYAAQALKSYHTGQARPSGLFSQLGQAQQAQSAYNNSLSNTISRISRDDSLSEGMLQQIKTALGIKK